LTVEDSLQFAAGASICSHWCPAGQFCGVGAL